MVNGQVLGEGRKKERREGEERRRGEGRRKSEASDKVAMFIRQQWEGRDGKGKESRRDERLGQWLEFAREGG
jgi:hypothetical protein